jgi:hypothetical protein
MAAGRKRPLFRRARPDEEDTLRLLIAEGDVADIVPADLLPSRELEADKAALTRIAEALAARGGIDRATGGHLLDRLIDSWHIGEVEEIKRTYVARETTVDRLIGAAERVHEEKLERLGFAADKYQRHIAAAERARLELIGPVAEPKVPHAAALERARNRSFGHENTCLSSPSWVPPWEEGLGTDLNTTLSDMSDWEVPNR